MPGDTCQAIPEECSLEDLVTISCRLLHDRIIADVQQKLLLKDEHYFQAELYQDLILTANDLDRDLKVKLEHKPKTLSHGHVDIAIINQSEPLDRDLLYINVARRTKSTNDYFTDEILQMATLSKKCDCLFVLVTDGREMADLRPPNDYLLYRKKKIVFKDIIDDILKGRDDLDLFKIHIADKLNLQDSLPEVVRLKMVKSYSHGKREKDRFAITVWRISGDTSGDDRPNSGSTFITEVRERGYKEQMYRLKNRLRASHEFELRKRKMVYVYSEIIMSAENEEKQDDQEKDGVSSIDET